MRIHSLLAVLLFTVAGCGDELRGPKAIIANHSDRTLNNVTLTGSGFVTSIGRIGARSVESATLHPTGESSLRVTFDVDGRAVDSGDCCYFENSPLYTVAVNIDREFKVAVLVDLKR
jgi:hypothetical protein